jgi:23S rRNA (adenine2503-C2)-methyltransferase
MNWPEVKDYLLAENFPKFRLKQIFVAYFNQLLSSWNEVTTLSQSDRQLLSEKFPWSTMEIINIQKDAETVKFSFKLIKDGQNIETVILKHKDGRRTVCVSCASGCAMNCAFCATGKMGFKRNLDSFEIYDQILYAARYLAKTKERVTNVVFMGMGEPMLNFDEVKEAITVLHDQEGFNLGWRHFSISTCGLPEGIRRQAEELPQVNLAISLHAVDDRLRSKLMPVNKKVSVEQLMSSCNFYIKKTGRKIFFEYLLLEGINDSPNQALALAELMKQNKLFHVNLLDYHTFELPVGFGANKFKKSSFRKASDFMSILEKEKISVTLRKSFGEKIDSACGQLANRPALNSFKDSR